MGRSSTPSFTLDIPLVVSSQSEKVLRSRFNAGLRLYSACLNEAEKRRKQMQGDAEYRAAKELPKQVKNARGKLIKNEERSKAFSAVAEKYGYREYDLHAYAKQSAADSRWIAFHLDSQCQQTLASRAFKASQNVIFTRARKVRFRGFNRFRSLEGKTGRQISKGFAGRMAVLCGVA